MRTADKAKLGGCIGIFPDNRIVILNSFKLGVIDDIFLRTVGNKALSKLYRFGRKTCDMIKTYCTVGSRCSAKILKIRAGRIVKFVA